MPAKVQAPLIGKVSGFDRNFSSRVESKVLIAIVLKASDVDSERAASQIQAAFRDVGPIAGYPHEEFLIRFTDARTLAATCAERKATIVYLSPGLHDQIDLISKVLEESGILSVAGSLSYVDKGTVLGFDLVSGRPKLVINLTAAKRQGLAFQSGLLNLARLVR